MLNGLRQFLGWAGGEGGKLAAFCILFILTWGTLAPIGTLVWWLDEGAEAVEANEQDLADQRPAENAEATSRTCYIVFLAGVGNFSDQELADGEVEFLERLQARQPECVLVPSVFPYSAANQNVGGQAFFAWLWTASEDLGDPLGLSQLILQVRNLWRFALSADNRYGKAYNRGIALTILEQMEAAQPIPNSDEPLQMILMGTSGGAQVALATAPYLKATLPVQITVISFGGVFDGNEGFSVAEQVYHFRGEKDWVENIGGILFPARWLWNWRSDYNRARSRDRYTAITSGPHEHDGDRGYFGQDPLDEEHTYLEKMLEQVNDLPIWPAADASRVKLDWRSRAIGRTVQRHSSKIDVIALSSSAETTSP